MATTMMDSIITSYEYIAAINIRVKQLEMVSEASIVKSDPTIKTRDPTTIAENEFRNKKLSFTVERRMPNGEIKYINLADENVVYLNDTTKKMNFKELDNIYN